MNDMEHEKRSLKASTETLVIAQTEGGFRVYNPGNLTNLYMVSGIPDAPKCNCPDYETHRNDPDWQCKHILAVLNQIAKRQSEPAARSPQEGHQNGNGQAVSLSSEKKKPRTSRNGHSQMLIKRSVSPDGYINSLSVEFITSIDLEADDSVKDQAQKVLKLQAEISDGFLKLNGNGKTVPERETHNDAETKGTQSNNDGNKGREADTAHQERSQNGNERTSGNVQNPDGSVPAQLLNVAGMNTSRGWTLFLNVQVNGKTAKIFGKKHELGEHVASAGFASIADHISQGMMLNLPCRVITKPSPDGKYLNVERVLPARPLEDKGRTGQ